MPRSDHEARITPSVLDRLLDFDPRSSSEGQKSRSQTLHELKASVGRDLEWLLNTRRLAFELTEDLYETNRSVVAYGIPDLTTLSPDSHLDQKALVKQIENAITIFEPRFLSAKVTLEAMGGTERSLRFRIDAQLDIDPAPEPVSFDTSLQSGSGYFEVTAV
ncbi:MAG TPA: type VI secretion system baseplate subunit TssE [Pyrinomonadaceae bacterium]|jgi:type VI secretion system protein ImpF|nr:type VI secretion system baseplate subunit TssE [Pyrinomonadaceae bacterium]